MSRLATANGYYQIAMHELGHATGHPLRLDRDTLKNGVGNFGGVEYAREELRVEMSAMLDPRPPLPVGADPGPRADDRPPEGDPPVPLRPAT